MKRLLSVIMLMLVLSACSNKQVIYDKILLKAKEEFVKGNYPRVKKEFKKASEIKISNNKASIYLKQIDAFLLLLEKGSKKEGDIVDQIMSEEGVDYIKEATIAHLLSGDDSRSDFLKWTQQYEIARNANEKNDFKTSNKELDSLEEVVGNSSDKFITSINNLRANNETKTSVIMDSNILREKYSSEINDSKEIFTILSLINSSTDDRWLSDISIGIMITNHSERNYTIGLDNFTLIDGNGNILSNSEEEGELLILAGETRLIENLFSELLDESIAQSGIGYYEVVVATTMSPDIGYYFNDEWVKFSE